MALGWIITAAVDEGSDPNQFWDGDEWTTGNDAADGSGNEVLLTDPSIANLSDACFLSENAGITIQDARIEEGTFQQQWVNRDVRLARARQTITLE